ncbi:VOC family protein [Microbacterium sp. EF45047]|uniref:VOC family protein n=1 Tax=Microbacterium sp. EF45047 TaxID=2809708 RepID=UPI00234B1AF9|nr:VOC family protein [Microbacterium sp. EF45047]
MFRGLANLNLVADDMAAAIDWYTRVFDAPPYFVRPEQGPPSTPSGASATTRTNSP